MVHSIIEYALTISGTPIPSQTLTNLKQFRELLPDFVVCNNFPRQSSVSAMLTALDLPTLKSRRTRAKLKLQ